MANTDPGYYGPIERHNVHRFWRPYGNRVWNNDIRNAGHRMIDSYVNRSEGHQPDWLAGSRYEPGEFATWLISDAFDSEQAYFVIDLISEASLVKTDDDSEAWDNVSRTLVAHGKLPTSVIDALHIRWESRFAQGYGLDHTESFLEQAREWTTGFIKGVEILIDEGILPIDQTEFRNRLMYPAEIAYIPQYVLRLYDLERGATGAELPFGAYSDYEQGCIFVNDYQDDPDITRSRFVHECIHFYLDGLVAERTIMDNHREVAQNCHIGMWEVCISTNPRTSELDETLSGNNYSKHLELNEGLTELVNKAIHNAVPELGEFSTRGQYNAWLELWEFLETRGLDLIPFLGYKLIDQTYDNTSTERLMWRINMIREFSRVFDPSDEGVNVWELFAERVTQQAQLCDVYDTDSTAFRGLLCEVSRLRRLKGKLGGYDTLHYPRPSDPYGKYLLSHGGTLVVKKFKGGKMIKYVKPK